MRIRTLFEVRQAGILDYSVVVVLFIRRGRRSQQRDEWAPFTASAVACQEVTYRLSARGPSTTSGATASARVLRQSTKEHLNYRQDLPPLVGLAASSKLIYPP